MTIIETGWMKNLKNIKPNKTLEEYAKIERIPDLKLDDIITDACYYSEKEPNEYYFFVHPASYRNQECPECHTVYYHKNGEVGHRIVHDLCINDIQVRISAQIMKYKCVNESCAKNPKFRHQYKCFVPGQQFTIRLYNYLKCKAFSTSFKQLAQKFGIDSKTVAHIFNKSSKELDMVRTFYAPKILGIDKINIGSKECFVFINCDIDGIMEITDDTSIEVIGDIIYGMADYHHIQYLSLSLSMLDYKDAVQELLPDAKIFIDKWHAIEGFSKYFSDAYENILEDEEKKLKQISDKKKLAKMEKHLKQADKWKDLFVLGNCRSIKKDTELEKQASLCKHFPNINLLRECMEELMSIYENGNESSVLQKLEDWLDRFSQDNSLKKYNGIKSLIKKMRKCLNELANYFCTECKTDNKVMPILINLLDEINRYSHGCSYDITRYKLLYAGYLMEYFEECMQNYPDNNRILDFSKINYYEPEILTSHFCFSKRFYGEYTTGECLVALAQNGYFEDL